MSVTDNLTQAQLREYLGITLWTAGLSPEEASKFFGATGRQIRRWMKGPAPLKPKQTEKIKRGIETIQERLADLQKDPQKAVWMGEIQAKLFTPQELAQIEAKREEKREGEKQFNAKVGAFIIELLNAATDAERESFLKTDDLITFQEVLWVAKQHGIKFPKGVL